ncbi:MAG: energy transducer TonB [Bacteroidota bacterium]
MILERIREGFLNRMRRAEGIAPKVEQSETNRLGFSAAVVFEVSLSFALVLVILTFKLFPSDMGGKKIIVHTQEMVKFEEIDRTKQENRPPPPPKPLIPIEAPSDEALEDVSIASSEIDIREDVAPPPPPSQETGGDEDYFIAVEDLPELVGGIAGLQKRVVYPEMAVRAGIQGRVFVLAFVNEVGHVVKAEVQKGIGGGCDEAAVKAVMESKFHPGKQRGKAVKVRVSIPVRFSLSTS